MKRIILIIPLLLYVGCQKNTADIRVGYAANLTHAQALIGMGDHRFEKQIANGVSIKGFVFHAGPSIVEALFAGELDFAYVGPVPAVTSILRTDGEFIVVSGSARGGAAIVAARGQNLKRLEDLRGKRILTPQWGNTQDVMARVKLKHLKPKIIPVSNPDQLILFRKQDGDAAWTVEPWVSRLIHETGARFFLDEEFFWQNDHHGLYPTTLLIARKSFLKEKPDLSLSFITAHVDLTKWIQENSQKARDLSNRVLADLLGEPLEPHVIKEAWNRIEFTWAMNRDVLEKNKENLLTVGFLRDGRIRHPEFIDRSFLEKVSP